MRSKMSTKRQPVSRAPQAAEQWDVVIVPFPFSTHAGHKRRPALVLSKRTFNQNGTSLLS